MRPSPQSSPSSSSDSSSCSTYNPDSNPKRTTRTPPSIPLSQPDGLTEGDDGPLIQLVYCSTATDPQLKREDLIRILEVCRKNNSKLGITGLLMYKDGQFVQFLEGPERLVRATFNRINKDERHRGVYSLLEQTITKRDFPNWPMAFRDLVRKEILPTNIENLTVESSSESRSENDAFNDIMTRPDTSSPILATTTNTKISDLVSLYHKLFMRT